MIHTLSNIHTHPFILTVLQHQLRQSVAGLRSNQPLLVLALCIPVTEEGRYEGIIKAVASITDGGVSLRLMVLVMMMIKLMKV